MGPISVVHGHLTIIHNINSRSLQFIKAEEIRIKEDEFELKLNLGWVDKILKRWLNSFGQMQS